MAASDSALYTVIDGSLVNLAKVNLIEDSKIQPGRVIIHFENNEKVVLDGTVQTVILKMGSGGS